MQNPVRRLAGSMAGLAHARLGLLATEGREELARFAFIVLGGCAALFLAVLALAIGSAAVIIAAGEAHRLIAATLLAVLFGALACYAVLRVRRELSVKPAAFGASLAELEADRAALVEGSHEHRSALVESSDELIRLLNIGLIAYTIGRRLRRAD